MKKILAFFVLSIVSLKVALAQQEVLSFDEHNKYIYYQVVDMPGLPADTLYLRANLIFKAFYPKITTKQTAPLALNGAGKFITYNGPSVMRHEAGEITYQLNVEFKDQKYRFWLTAFVFTPYQRDRYNNYVPQTGVDIPLESVSAKLEKRDADDALNSAGLFCKQWADKFKTYLTRAEEPKKEAPVKKVVTDNW
jgi:hypothetical protein